MLWTCTVVVGSGTLQTNNMGEMVAIQQFFEQVVLACLALFSVSQATARVITGTLSENVLNWKFNICLCPIDHGIPRPFFLVVALIVACVAHLIYFLGNTQNFFVLATIVSGVPLGWSGH